MFVKNMLLLQPVWLIRNHAMQTQIANMLKIMDKLNVFIDVLFTIVNMLKQKVDANK